MRRYIAMPGVTELAQEYVSIETFPDGETAITVPDIGMDDDIVLIGNCPTAQASESFLASACHAGVELHSPTLASRLDDLPNRRSPRAFTSSPRPVSGWQASTVRPR